MDFSERPLAITDCETSGLNSRKHEILEVGLVLVDQRSLEILDRYASKARPIRIEDADPVALEINGYSEAEWRDAPPLKEVLAEYATRVPEAAFAAHNMAFDWGFMDAAFEREGVAHSMDYHRIDLFTAGYELLRARGIVPRKYNLDGFAQALGIPTEPKPHRALGGALAAYGVWKALRT